MIVLLVAIYKFFNKKIYFNKSKKKLVPGLQVHENKCEPTTSYNNIIR